MNLPQAGANDRSLCHCLPRIAEIHFPAWQTSTVRIDFVLSLPFPSYSKSFEFHKRMKYEMGCHHLRPCRLRLKDVCSTAQDIDSRAVQTLFSMSLCLKLEFRLIARGGRQRYFGPPWHSRDTASRCCKQSANVSSSGVTSISSDSSQKYFSSQVPEPTDT